MFATRLVQLALVATLVFVFLSARPWRWLRCGEPMGIDRTVSARGRLVRCDLAWRHAGRHRLPQGATISPPLSSGPAGYRGTFATPVRCGAGHVHADQGDALACMFGGE